MAPSLAGSRLRLGAHWQLPPCHGPYSVGPQLSGWPGAGRGAGGPYATIMIITVGHRDCQAAGTPAAVGVLPALSDRRHRARLSSKFKFFRLGVTGSSSCIMTKAHSNFRPAERAA